ncbi:MAG: lipase family protein [Bacteroidetes bacterium]|nr:lipase family protein [Bacteroidota bacterium]
MKKYFLFLFLSASVLHLSARNLQPGFDGNEFRKMLSVSAYQVDTPWVNKWMPYPVGYDLIYRSPVSGMDNRWDLWKSKDSVCVISVRGTIGTTPSWTENFYSGMIRAKGKLNMGNGKFFEYKLAEDSNACVHIGWTVGLANLAPEIIEKINEQYKLGIKNFILMGHSQGGAIIDLLTSYLHYEKGKSIPADIVFKTYASGVPKVGNQAYAYDFDFITRGGWAFRIVSSADWVPEVPFSIQAMDDIEKGNPFENINLLIGGAKWPVKFLAKHVIRKMNRSVKRSRKQFVKYLGKDCGKFVCKNIPGFPKQDFVASLNYMTCGIPIIFQADAAYHKLYPDDPKSIFRHHGFTQYLYLLNQYYPVI